MPFIRAKEIQAQMETCDDLFSAMMLCEEYEVDTAGLETLEEVLERLQMECDRLRGAQFKEAIEKTLRESGKEDVTKRTRLKQMFTDLLGIIEREGAVGKSKERFKFVEKSLDTEGTTHDIIGDCNKRISDLRHGECVILVAGESSAGKSSVLNLLLGEDILPVHCKSCTAVITVIKYDKSKHASVIYTNGKVLEIPKLDEHGIKQLHEIAFPQEESFRMGHEIKEIHLFLPLPFLQAGLVLADTPGIGENDFLEEYLVDYIRDNQILGFMYIIMSDAAGGVQEDRLLNLLKIIIKQQKQDLRFDHRAALFVCNRFDMVPEAERQMVKEHIQEKLGSCWPEFSASQAVTFSTYCAKRDVTAHPDYINGQYKQLLEGLKNLYIVAMDRRIRSSYRWIEKILKRVIHYLKAKVVRLDLSQRELYEKTAESKERLQALTHRSGEFLQDMRSDLDEGVERICSEAKEFLRSSSTKMRFTYMWTDKELPDSSSISINNNVSTAVWLKQKLDDMFHDRLCDILEEWDKETCRIDSLEERMTRAIRDRLNLLEEDIADIESEIQGESTENPKIPFGKTSAAFRFSVSIPEESLEMSHLQMKFNKKAVTRMRNPLAKILQPGQARRFLEKYRADPKAVASERATKFYKKLLSIRSASDELLPFIRQLMQRPYEYLNILQKKIPDLIEANQISLAEAEETAAFDRQHQAVYVEMMTSIEELRRSLMDYGEGYVFVNDFKSNEIKVECDLDGGGSIARTLNVVNIINRSSSSDQQGNAEMVNPHGLWTAIYSGKLCRMSHDGTTGEKPIAIRMYNPSSGVDHTFQEVAKLRCLVHKGVSLAEFLGIHHADCPTPAYIYDGQLKSMRRYLSSCSNAMEQVPRLLQETLRGLQYLHNKGLVHMELTRDTVTVDQQGNVRMTGACLPREARIPVNTSNVTADFIYLAPEVLQGDLYLATADLYCFGLLVFETTAKRTDHFRRQRKVAFCEFVQKMDPLEMLQLEEQGDRVSEGAKSLIKNCVNTDPAQRPPIDELQQQLRALQDNIAMRSSGTITPAEAFRLSAAR